MLHAIPIFLALGGQAVNQQMPSSPPPPSAKVQIAPAQVIQRISSPFSLHNLHAGFQSSIFI